MKITKTLRSEQILLLLLVVLGALVALLLQGQSEDQEQAALTESSVPLELVEEYGSISEVGKQSPGLQADALLEGARTEVLPAAPDSIVLASNEGETRGARVVDRATGAAVQGARVLLLDDDWTVEGETDSAGRFELRVPLGAHPRLDISSSEYAPLRQPLLSAAEGQVFELAPAGTIRGRVQGVLPEECVGAAVQLWRLSDSHFYGETLAAEASTVVDSEGHFFFGGLGAGDYSIGVQVKGWGLGFHHSVSVSEGEQTDLAVSVSRGVKVQGQVTFLKSKQPAAGVRLCAEPLLERGLSLSDWTKQPDPSSTDQPGAMGRVSTLSDGDGNFQLEGLPVGGISLWVETTDGELLHEMLLGSITGEVLEHDFQLAETATLSGQVLSDSGLGVPGARVQLSWTTTLPWEQADPNRSISEGSVEVSTGPSGEFQVAGLPTRRPLLILASSGPGDWRMAEASSPPRQITLRPGQERDKYKLVVYPTRSVEGVVRDGEGAPVVGANIHLERLTEKRGYLRPLQQTKTDSLGAFHLAGLTLGGHEVRVEAAGYMPTSERINVRPGTITIDALELRVEEARTIQGWVLDQHEDVVPHAKVVAMPSSSIPRKQKNHISGTDEYGRFELRNLEPGWFTLHAKAPGYSSIVEGNGLVVPASSTEVALTLLRDEVVGGCLVTGTLSTPGGAVPPTLRLSDPHGGVFKMDGTSFMISGMRSPEPVRLRFTASGFELITPEINLIPHGEVNVGHLLLVPQGEVTIVATNEAGVPLKNYRARLERVAAGGAGKSDRSKPGASIQLNEHRRIRHRFKGSSDGPRKVNARYSSRVPYGRWRLVVQAQGFKNHRRMLTLSGEQSKKRVEVMLTKRP